MNKTLISVSVLSFSLSIGCGPSGGDPTPIVTTCPEAETALITTEISVANDLAQTRITTETSVYNGPRDLAQAIAPQNLLVECSVHKNKYPPDPQEWNPEGSRVASFSYLDWKGNGLNELTITYGYDPNGSGNFDGTNDGVRSITNTYGYDPNGSGNFDIKNDRVRTNSELIGVGITLEEIDACIDLAISHTTFCTPVIKEANFTFANKLWHIFRQFVFGY